MEIRICECPKSDCKIQWIPRTRGVEPKECPICKTRYVGGWAMKLKCKSVPVNSAEDIKRVKAEVKAWNEKGRFQNKP